MDRENLNISNSETETSELEAIENIYVNETSNENTCNVKNRKTIKSKTIFFCFVFLMIIFIALMYVTNSPERYMAKGNYIKAYEIAAEEKETVEAENAIAVCSAMCVSKLKDTESFTLLNAFYNTDSKRQVGLEISANNSYGNPVINYWLFTWDTEKEKFEYFSSFASFKEDIIYPWDTPLEKYEKNNDNLARYTFAVLDSNKENKLTVDSITNINNLYKKDLLKKVDLIGIKERKPKGNISNL